MNFHFTYKILPTRISTPFPWLSFTSLTLGHVFLIFISFHFEVPSKSMNFSLSHALASTFMKLRQTSCEPNKINLLMLADWWREMRNEIRLKLDTLFYPCPQWVDGLKSRQRMRDFAHIHQVAGQTSLKIFRTSIQSNNAQSNVLFSYENKREVTQWTR